MAEACPLAVGEDLAPADFEVFDQAKVDERLAGALDGSSVAVLAGGAQMLVARVGPPLGDPRGIRGQQLEKSSRRSR
jgi:hypothetical protein